MNIKLVKLNDAPVSKRKNIVVVQEDDEALILALADSNGKSDWQGEDSFLRIKLGPNGEIRVIQIMAKAGYSVKFEPVQPEFVR